MAQNVEEGLRQQAVNRAQRVKKQMQDEFSHVHGSGVASDDSSQPKHLRLTDIRSSTADSSPADDQLPSGSHIEGSISSLAAEMELVMRPHPQLSKHDVHDSQTRFIKTTSNATGIINDHALASNLMFLYMCLVTYSISASRYCNLSCLLVGSLVHSFVNILDQISRKWFDGLGSNDHQLEVAFGKSNGHVIDDIT